MNLEQIDNFLYYFKKELQFRSFQVQLYKYEEDPSGSNNCLLHGNENGSDIADFNESFNVSILDGFLGPETTSRILYNYCENENLVFLYSEGKFVLLKISSEIDITGDLFKNKSKSYSADHTILNMKPAVCTRTLYSANRMAKLVDLAVFTDDRLSAEFLSGAFADLGLSAVFIGNSFRLYELSKFRENSHEILFPDKTNDISAIIRSASATIVFAENAETGTDRIPFEILIAMASGLPVLTDISLYEMGIGKNNYISFHHLSDIKDKVFDIMIDKSKVNFITSNALRLVNKNFTMYHRVNAFLDICEISLQSLPDHRIKNHA